MPSSAAEKATLAANRTAKAAANVQNLLNGHGIDPWSGIDVSIGHNGNKIILPDTPIPMSFDVAIDTLSRKRDEEEERVSINETTDAFPKDGAVAFQKAMQRMFGWVSSVPTPGFFGSTPPSTIDVEINHNERISVVWGKFEIPGVEGYVACDYYTTPKGPRFVIRGEVKRKHHHIIRQLAEMTRKIAAEESIYRNKSIQLTVDDEGKIDWSDGITFTDFSGVNNEELIFSEQTALQIETSLWTLIEQTDRCRQFKIPLKRGILMEGKYGTGKSLTSAVTARKAISNGWTFLSITRVSGLSDALNFARKFQPCVIFAEDVDRVIEGSERTQEIDDILNTIDGIESKGTEIMVVLTTNHVERINRAMLRPGRLDAIITITPPDAQAVKKLIRLYGRTTIDSNDELIKASESLAGQIPATIRECTERAKLYAIWRTKGSMKNLLITDEDVYHAAIGMKPHMDLLEEKVTEKTNSFSLHDLIKVAVTDSIYDLSAAVAKISGNVTTINGTTAKTQAEVVELSRGRMSSIIDLLMMIDQVKNGSRNR